MLPCALGVIEQVIPKEGNCSIVDVIDVLRHKQFICMNGRLLREKNPFALRNSQEVGPCYDMRRRLREDEIVDTVKESIER